MLNYLYNRKARVHKGFSLVELLVVLLIMSVMASVAVPLYINQKSRAYLQTATSDANAIGQEITAIVSDYNSFGSGTCTANACPITIASNVLTFTAMTAATGFGTFSTTGPGTTASTVRLSTGSSLSSANAGSGAGKAWCIVISNSTTYAKYTNAGLQTQQIGGTAPTCSAGA